MYIIQAIIILTRETIITMSYDHYGLPPSICYISMSDRPLYDLDLSQHTILFNKATLFPKTIDCAATLL